MTDTVKTWIEERRAIHAKVPGEAWENYATPPFEVYDATEYDDGDMGEVLAETRAFSTSREIVDAHNSLPRALNALEQVLRLLDGWEPPDPCMGPDITKCVDCLQIQEMRRAIEGAINHD